jgi:hypothetical protein
VPGEEAPLQEAGGAVGQLAEQRVDEDPEQTTSVCRNSRAFMVM